MSWASIFAKDRVIKMADTSEASTSGRDNGGKSKKGLIIALGCVVVAAVIVIVTFAVINSMATKKVKSSVDAQLTALGVADALTYQSISVNSAGGEITLSGVSYGKENDSDYVSVKRLSISVPPNEALALISKPESGKFSSVKITLNGASIKDGEQGLSISSADLQLGAKGEFRSPLTSNVADYKVREVNLKASGLVLSLEGANAGGKVDDLSLSASGEFTPEELTQSNPLGAISRLRTLSLHAKNLALSLPPELAIFLGTDAAGLADPAKTTLKSLDLDVRDEREVITVKKLAIDSPLVKAEGQGVIPLSSDSGFGLDASLKLWSLDPALKPLVSELLAARGKTLPDTFPVTLSLKPGEGGAPTLTVK
jgi:hypothetical protein